MSQAWPPVTRQRGVAWLLLPLPVAVAGGLATGLAPDAALVVLCAIASVAVLVPRVEWAALAVIGSAVFEDYLDLVSRWGTEWLAALLVAAWLVRRARGPLHGHRLRGAGLSVALLLLVVLAAYAVHPHGAAGLEVCARYAGLGVLMLVLADCLSGPLAPRRAARAYVLACVAASVCGLATAALSESHRVSGPVAAPDTLAFFLVAAVPMVGTVRTRPDQPAWWVWSCVVVLLAAGVGTHSQGALAALLGMVLAALVTGQLAPRHAGALLALLVTGMALVVAVRPVPAGHALSDAQQHADRTFQEQNNLRRAALDMTRESPVLGLGPAAFRLLHQDHLPAGVRVPAPVRNAYSTPLEVAAELGVLGVLALYAVWLLRGVSAARRWLRDRSGLTGATLLALGGLLAVSLVESQQYALPLWLLAAMAHAQGVSSTRRAPIFADPTAARTSGQVAPTS